MSRIVVDNNLAEQLNKVHGPTEVCDEAGNTLGRFVPGADAEEWVSITPELSEEELRRRLNANEKRYSTAEVLAFLEKLDGQR